VLRKRNIITNMAGVLAMPLIASPGFAATIDNNLPESTVGYLSVEVQAGGQSTTARVTAMSVSSDAVFRNTDILFSYQSYIDVGELGNAFQLSNSDVALSGVMLITNSGENSEALSTGSFTGDLGNIIDWSVSTTIPNGSSTLTNVLSFSARSGTLGDIRFYQAIDQDVLTSGNNLFFTRGSVDSGDLELFTANFSEGIAASQSGALNDSEGLLNATFSGWAGCTFPIIEELIREGTEAISLTGEICSNLTNRAINHPTFGPGFGPADVVSALGWNVDPNASNATIITTYNTAGPSEIALCNGLMVTVDIGQGQTPTQGSDVILGTEGPDTIRALGGNDTICGLGGNDLINAGAGDDYVEAGPGNDRVFGITGDDTLLGDTGADRLFGGPGFDVIKGGSGDDRLNGGGGGDFIFAGSGNDQLYGQYGNDSLHGEDGNDIINGAAGNDFLSGGAGSDRLVGDLNNTQAGDDFLDGGSGADVFLGRAGNDVCFVESEDLSSDC